MLGGAPNERYLFGDTCDEHYSIQGFCIMLVYQSLRTTLNPKPVRVSEAYSKLSSGMGTVFTRMHACRSRGVRV